MGIKEFVLADLRTGYILMFSSALVQLLKQKQQRNCMGYTCTHAVLDLVRGLAYKAHVLYGDNHYTNLTMFMELYMDDVYATSTARLKNELSKTRQLPRVQRGYYKHRSRSPKP